MILGWASPIGFGIFLFLLGSMIYMIAKADEISKRTKREYKDKPQIITNLWDGGEGGIRTRGNRKATHALQACLIVHSSTSP